MEFPELTPAEQAKMDAFSRALSNMVEKAKEKIEEVKEKAIEVVEEVKGQVKHKIENCECGCKEAPTAETTTEEVKKK